MERQRPTVWVGSTSLLGMFPIPQFHIPFLPSLDFSRLLVGLPLLWTFHGTVTPTSSSPTMSAVIPAYYFPLPFILARMQWYPTVARQQGLWANAPAGDVPNSPIPHTPSPSLVFVHLLIYLPLLWSVIVRSYRPLPHRESARSYRPTVPSFPSSLGPTQWYPTVV